MSMAKSVYLVNEDSMQNFLQTRQQFK
jgi:hypothetical protein